MGSPPTDVLMLNGVAALVRDLAEFAPVHELFQTHLKRWRKKNALIVAQRRKAKAQLATLWRDEPHVPDPDKEEHWPARRIYSPDRTKSELFAVPPELDRKLKKYNDPNPKELDRKLKEYNDPSRYHLLRSLDDKQDFSTTESFVLLAELHDAAYQSSPIGYAIDHIVSVAEATNILKDGMSQVAVERLATLVEKSIDRIDSQADANAKNRSGETLQQTIKRSRKKLVDLVTLSRQHFVTHTDLESVQDAVERLQSDVKASLMIPEPAAAGSSVDSVVREFAKATERVPDEYKEQGRECGPLEGGKTALAKAVTRNPKARPKDLNKHHGRKVFVREISRRKLEVFFRTFREFNAAKELLTSPNYE